MSFLCKLAQSLHTKWPLSFSFQTLMYCVGIEVEMDSLSVVKLLW